MTYFRRLRKIGGREGSESNFVEASSKVWPILQKRDLFISACPTLKYLLRHVENRVHVNLTVL